MRHALFGGSSAHRWLKCPLSNMLWSRVEEQYKQTLGSNIVEGNIEAMRRGTAIHTLAYDTYVGMNRSIFKSFNDTAKETLSSFLTVSIPDVNYDYLVTEDMREEALFYLCELDAMLSGVPHQLELEINCDHLAPDNTPGIVFGTFDCVGIDTFTETLHVIDLKTGFTKVNAAGVIVEVEDDDDEYNPAGNEQLMLGASGAYNKMSDEDKQKIKYIDLCIVQSFYKKTRHHVISVEELNTFTEEAKKSLKSLKDAVDMLSSSDAAKAINDLFSSGLIDDGLQLTLNTVSEYLCKKPTQHVCKYCKIKDHVVCPALSKVKDPMLKEVIKIGDDKKLQHKKATTAFTQLQQEYAKIDAVKLWIKATEKALEKRLKTLPEDKQQEAIYVLQPARSTRYDFIGSEKELFKEVYGREYDADNLEDVELMQKFYTPINLKSWPAIRDMLKEEGVDTGNIELMFEPRESKTLNIVKKVFDKNKTI